MALYLGYPFGMLMQGRTIILNNANYRYGFNSQENDDEVKGQSNMMGAEFWEYDARVGRRWNIDPKPTVDISPYATFGLNPILHTDPLGDTIIVNNTGHIISNDKKDNVVMLHHYVDNSNRQIGELGKTIDATEIITNLLLRDVDEEKGYTLWDWKNKVAQDQPWDFKDDYIKSDNKTKGTNPTIFGLAWDYDKTHNTNDNPHTLFTFNSYKMNAADFGNYHAGYTGSALGISEKLQKVGAGVFEVKKNEDNSWLKTGWHYYIHPLTPLVPPYGDAPIDYKWNTQGMKDAPKPVRSNSKAKEDILHTSPYLN